MTGFVRNDGGHVPVGTGQQVPSSSIADKYGRAASRGENARRVPSPCRVRKHKGAFGSGDFTKQLVGMRAAHCADREKEEQPVEVRQIPGTELAVVTEKTANQSARIPHIDLSRRV